MFRNIFLLSTLLVFGYGYQQAEYDILVPKEHLPEGTLVRVRRQWFGGVSSNSAGYRGSVFSTPNHDVSAWGSVGQVGRNPVTLSGGADWTAPRGGLSASATHAFGGGSQFTLGGNANILKTPNHQLDAFASHTRTFDRSFHQIGDGSTTAGLGYQHHNGGSLTLSGTRTPGAPDVASITGSVPLYTSKDNSAKLDLNAGMNFAEGHKPQSQVGITFEKKF